MDVVARFTIDIEGMPDFTLSLAQARELHAKLAQALNLVSPAPVPGPPPHGPSS